MKPSPTTLSEFIKQVDQIAEAKSFSAYMKLIGDASYRESAGAYARDLEAVFSSIQSSLPASSTLLPSGKRWAGTALPEGWSDAQVLLPAGNTDKPTRRGSLLHLASILRVRPKWIGWLLASGVDPLKYCPETGNAPLGQMAYSGDHASVRVLRRAGIDLTLRLDPSHLEMSNPKQARLAGTTLLHRMVNRSSFKDQSLCKVVDELLLAGLSPLDVSLMGESALSLCRDSEMLARLERRVAKESKANLVKNVAPAKSRASNPGKRF